MLPVLPASALLAGDDGGTVLNGTVEFPGPEVELGWSSDAEPAGGEVDLARCADGQNQGGPILAVQFIGTVVGAVAAV